MDSQGCGFLVQKSGVGKKCWKCAKRIVHCSRMFACVRCTLVSMSEYVFERNSIYVYVGGGGGRVGE